MKKKQIELSAKGAKFLQQLKQRLPHPSNEVSSEVIMNCILNAYAESYGEDAYRALAAKLVLNETKEE